MIKLVATQAFRYECIRRATCTPIHDQEWLLRLGETHIFPNDFQSRVFGVPSISMCVQTVRVYSEDRSSVFGRGAVRVYSAAVFVCVLAITHHRFLLAMTPPNFKEFGEACNDHVWQCRWLWALQILSLPWNTHQYCFDA